MKGLTEEMFYLAIIVLAVLMLFTFFSYQRGTRGIEVKRSVEERILNEEGSAAIFTLFNNKLPLVEKSYVECAVDSLLEGTFSKKEKDKAFYGIGIGKVNVSEIIPPLFEKYAKGKWELKIITPDGEYSYGRVKKNEVVYTFETLIPVPEERVGKLILFLS